MTSKKKILEELQKRIETSTGVSTGVVLDLNKIAFPKQLSFITDPSHFKTALCSRRAGKTMSIALDMTETCQRYANSVCLYITLTSKSARAIIWNDIKSILEKNKIKCKTDETRLRVTFPNKSEIRIEGCKDQTEGEKFRGWKIRKVYIDECQSFRPYIKEVINNVLIPTLRDLNGSIILTGTPGPMPTGAFYEYTHSNLWSNHYWTAFDNPHMHDPVNGRDLNQRLELEWSVKGISKNDPSVQREDFGLWVKDENSLVFRFDKNKNICTSLPTNLEYVFGIDLGFEDSDAIAVLGYSFTDNKVYLVEEDIQNKQGISALVRKIEELQIKYKPSRMVIDEGGLGKKIAEEIRHRYSIPLVAAEKTRKNEFIELLNDDLRTAKFKAIDESRFEQDSYLVQWDRSNPSRPKISDNYHSDITDAVLYAWRECKHYFYKPEAPKPVISKDAYMEQLEKKEASKMKEKQSKEWWDSSDLSDEEPESTEIWDIYDDSE